MAHPSALRRPFHSVLILLCAVSALAAAPASAHGVADGEAAIDARAIDFPDTADHLTLVFDPHTHTVFSDGHVWPTIRVAEAQRDGLDAYAVTEHLEYQPHRVDVPHPDRNRAFEIAVEAASGSDLIVVPGSEITRELPVGHINALFLTDANALVRVPDAAAVASARERMAAADLPPGIEISDTVAHYVAAGDWPAQEALRAAHAQGAFVFLNHVYWTAQRPNGIAELTDFHRAMFDAGLVQGIEVANGDTYSEASFAIALEHDLTIIGTSDVHDLIDWDYPPAAAPAAGGHRPVTLVLAESRDADGLREALLAGRTVAWYRNLLLGRAEHLGPILEAAVSVVSAAYLPDTDVLRVVLRNDSDTRLQLSNRSVLAFTGAADLVELAPHAETILDVTPGRRVDALSLDFEVLNALVAPGTPARLSLAVRIEDA